MDTTRNSYPASLTLLQNHGFAGRTFLDIGAAEGALFLVRRQLNLFPDAQHFFVDAMQENEAGYRKIARAFGADYAITALSCLEGSVQLSVDPNFYNTHITGLQKVDYASVRTVPLTTLDKLVAGRSLPAPYILKLDVQGAELDVLRGALRTLEQASIVTTEIQVFFERDTLVELLSFMQGRGFALFDITDPAYYPSNGALYQCYATFIPHRLEFRSKLNWCLPEQEAGLNAQLRARRDEIIREIDSLTRS